MLKKSILALGIALGSIGASADPWVVGGDYMSIGGITGVTALVGSGAYKLPVEVSIIPDKEQYILVGGRFGIGFGDDDYYELDSLFGGFAKYQVILTEQWYTHAMAAVTSVKYSSTFSSFTFTDTDPTIGIGGGYILNERSALEANFELFDYDHVLSFGYRYQL